MYICIEDFHGYDTRHLTLYQNDVFIGLYEMKFGD